MSIFNMKKSILLVVSVVSTIASAQLVPGPGHGGGGHNPPPHYNPCDVPTDPNCPGHGNGNGGYNPPGNGGYYPPPNNGGGGYYPPPNNGGYYDSDAQRICLNAAYRYQSYGYSIDPYGWCSDVYTLGVAYCRDGGLDYKARGGYLPSVKDWCSDVYSTSEGRCRQSALDQKLRTGYPSSVKDYCR